MIKYKQNDIEHEISSNVRCFGMSLLWTVATDSHMPTNKKQSEMLQEIHAIFGSVLYGEIKNGAYNDLKDKLRRRNAQIKELKEEKRILLSVRDTWLKKWALARKENPETCNKIDNLIEF